uniref:Uncharacterized protein n=1 Tax=Acrobeloides nanus TaxID=290746 RepID=A0A914EFP1_9BILA
MAQEKQVEKMLETSKQWYASVEVGITVRLLIPSVDRPKIGHANLLDVVIEAGNGLYKIGTKSCILPQKFTRNQLEPSDNEFVLSSALHVHWRIYDKEVCLQEGRDDMQQSLPPQQIMYKYIKNVICSLNFVKIV